MDSERRRFAKRAASMFLAAPIRGKNDSQNAARSSPAITNTTHPVRHFENPLFEYTFLISLGRSYHSAGNIGKVRYIAEQIRDGDFESAFQAFKLAGDEAHTLAEQCADSGHRVSAREAYLWAQNYYDSSTYFLDGSQDASRFLPIWEVLNDCWIRFAALCDPPIEPVRIPYENTELHGFFFKASREKTKRPLLILNNGSDGSLLDMWTQGGAGAVARGYNCLTFDGPGQGYALWKQKLYFRPDWEEVITPVIDYALTRPDVDPRRIAVQGISQGGYWVPRAAACDKRIAAVVADPGVVDVSTSWTGSLPDPMKMLLKAGRKREFDSFMSRALNSPAAGATLRFRMRPYGLTSPYERSKPLKRISSGMLPPGSAVLC